MDLACRRHQARWILYTAFVLGRIVVAPFLLGYVHPDEFFQGGQELWFGCPPFTPWEFEPQSALRSVVPPSFLTWTPLRVFTWINSQPMEGLQGWQILVLPRIWCGLLSVLTVDLPVLYMTMNASSATGPSAALCMVASSWTSWVMLNRPFTNAAETMILCVLLLVTHCKCSMDILVGILCAAGVFTRFTFCFVAVPTMIRYTFLDKSSLQSMLHRLLWLALGFGTSAVCITYFDMQYYNQRGNQPWTSFVTPWNALRYNSQINNLQEHGLHPRWTHALVNIVLMFGPMAIMFYTRLARTAVSRIRGRKEQSQTKLQVTCMWTILSGLAFLSLAPHQEPRFLLPLLVPLVILSTFSGKMQWSTWIVFNSIMLVVYGLLHQGGVLRSLLNTVEGESRAVLYYHTYMPPTFCSRMSSEACDAASWLEGTCSARQSTCGHSTIVDLKGTSVAELMMVLNNHLKCDKGGEDGKYVYLVSPPLTGGKVVVGPDCSMVDAFTCQRIQSYWPHLTTEDFPPFNGSLVDLFRSMELSVYNVSCQ